MKNFLVFMGYNYYPSGGWDDFYASFDTYDDAISEVKKEALNRDWVQIVDMQSTRVTTFSRWDILNDKIS